MRVVIWNFLFLFSFQTLQADTIFLRNGSSIEGKVKTHKLNYILIEDLEGNEKQIPKDLIRKITYGSLHKKLEEEEEPEILKNYPPIIFEVTKDGRIYTIPVFGRKFPSSIKVKLVSDKYEKAQKYRNLSENSFTLLVDPEGMETGEYDLVVESEEGIFIQRILRFVEIIEKPIVKAIP